MIIIIICRETHLSKRVREWTTKLEPLLEAQELAPVFDIHEYAQRVLDEASDLVHQHELTRKDVDTTTEASMESAKEDVKMVDFEDLVQGNNRGEVCRFFLSCLQLANFGNIEVVPERLLSSQQELIHNNRGNFSGKFHFKLLEENQVVRSSQFSEIM